MTALCSKERHYRIFQGCKQACPLLCKVVALRLFMIDASLKDCPGKKERQYISSKICSNGRDKKRIVSQLYACFFSTLSWLLGNLPRMFVTMNNPTEAGTNLLISLLKHLIKATINRTPNRRCWLFCVEFNNVSQVPDPISGTQLTDH